MEKTETTTCWNAEHAKWGWNCKRIVASQDGSTNRFHLAREVGAVTRHYEPNEDMGYGMHAGPDGLTHYEDSGHNAACNKRFQTFHSFEEWSCNLTCTSCDKKTGQTRITPEGVE